MMVHRDGEAPKCTQMHPSLHSHQDVSADADDADVLEQALSRHLMSALRAGWLEGRAISAAELLAEHPQLLQRKSIVLDLAYEEYCLRCEAGEAPQRDAFCKPFSCHRHSLERLLSVHEFLRRNSDLLIDAQSADWPDVGRTIAGFELLELLGKGGFARVYLAEELALGRRRVAVKISQEGDAEAEILGRLEHPNIVPVHSVLYDAPTRMTLICMPFSGRVTLADVLDRWACDGFPRRARAILTVLEGSVSLQSRTRRQQPDALVRRRSYVDWVASLGAQLAEGLAHAHGNGVCHLDLKPSNVLLDETGKPMLLDFNLSHDPQTSRRRAGGTLPYMAPERIQSLLLAPEDASAVPDPRSDLFSLGVVLFEMLTGFLPFEVTPAEGQRREAAMKLWQRQQLALPSLQQNQPKVDQSLVGIIQRCLAFEPADRFQSAEELAAQLRWCLSPSGRAQRYLRAHRSSTIGAAAVVCFLGAGTTYRLMTRPPYAERELTFARSEMQANNASQALEHITNVMNLGPPSQSAKALSGEIYYALAKEALYAERFPESRDLCTRAIDVGLDSWQVRLCRGRAHFGAREHLVAFEDYKKAAMLHDCGALDAAIADCECGLEQYESAIIRYQRALKQGFESAGMYNNLGFAQTRRGRLEKALESLHRGVQLDNRSGTIFWNRAVTQWRLAESYSKPISDLALADVRQAIQLGPPAAHIYLDAALMHYRSVAGEGDDDRRERGLAFLLQAIRLGSEVKRIEAIRLVRSMLAVLRERQQLDDAERQGAEVPPQPPERLVDSLAGIAIDSL